MSYFIDSIFMVSTVFTCTVRCRIVLVPETECLLFLRVWACFGVVVVAVAKFIQGGVLSILRDITVRYSAVLLVQQWAVVFAAHGT